jgi:hypothetical protein
VLGVEFRVLEVLYLRESQREGEKEGGRKGGREKERELIAQGMKK